MGFVVFIIFFVVVGSTCDMACDPRRDPDGYWCRMWTFDWHWYYLLALLLIPGVLPAAFYALKAPFVLLGWLFREHFLPPKRPDPVPQRPEPPAAPQPLTASVPKLVETIMQGIEAPPDLRPVMESVAADLCRQARITAPITGPAAATDAIRSSLQGFVRSIPNEYRHGSTESPFRVSALDVVRENSFVSVVCPVETPLFPAIKDQSLQNFLAWERREPKTREECLECWMGGIPLSRLYSTQLPFTLDPTTRFSGHWITAPPNSGKTNLLNGMILSDLKAVAAGKASLIMIDSKTHPTEALIDGWRTVNFAKLDPRLAGKVHIFDPDTDLAINFFELGDLTRTIECLEYLFLLLYREVTELQSTLLTKCIMLIKASPQPSIPALIKLLRDGIQGFEPALRTLDYDDQVFFLGSSGAVPDFDGKLYGPRRAEVRSRLEQLTIKIPVLRETFRSTETKIDLRALIDGGNILIVNAKAGLLGDKGSEFWQRLWTMMLLDAARRREKYIPCYCYLDEAHKGIARDTRLADILDECRSARLALIIAHQGKNQITDRAVLSALERCAIQFEHDRPLKQGQFTAFIRGLPQESVVVTAVHASPSKLPQLTAAEQMALGADMRKRYSVTPPQPPRSEPIREPAAIPAPVTPTRPAPAPDDTSPSKEW